MKKINDFFEIKLLFIHFLKAQSQIHPDCPKGVMSQTFDLSPEMSAISNINLSDKRKFSFGQPQTHHTRWTLTPL
jgi:hypothetical protein